MFLLALVSALAATVVATTPATSLPFSEHLQLRPLPQNRLLAEFDFTVEQSRSLHDYSLFPRLLGQILDHASVDELHLRMSSGWWDAETWGAEPGNGTKSGGIGVELWALMNADSAEEAQQKWHRLVYSLSGHFCASINFMDDTVTSQPPGRGWWMRGALPAEPVCTENLTPFLKLLPCKSDAGIASLLEGHYLFDSQWQSMRIDVTRGTNGRILNAGVAAVSDVERTLRRRDSPVPYPIPFESLKCDETKPGNSEWSCYPLVDSSADWRLSEIFGSSIAQLCPVASASTIEVDAPSNWDISPACQLVLASRTETVELSLPVDIEMKTADSQVVSALPQPHIMVDRSMTQWGQQRGGLRTVFANPTSESVTMQYSETLPWFMRLYLNTLVLPEGSRLVRYIAAEDRGRPSQLLFEVTVPAQSQVSLEYQFEKSLLFLEEYPPDANHGFEVAPGIAFGDDWIVRTSSLLISLPVPDFSMPYNVVIFTCTVMTLAYGTLFNLVTRRVIPESEVPPAPPRVSPLQKLRALLKR